MSIRSGTRILKAPSQRSFASLAPKMGFFYGTPYFSKIAPAHHQETLNARYRLAKACVPSQQNRSFFSLSRLSSFPAAGGATRGTTALNQGQTIRAFSQRATPYTGNATTRPFPARSRVIHQQLRSYAQYPITKKRPIRFLLKMMAVSTALVAVPAIFVFGAPVASIVFIPIVVGGVLGGTLLLTGGIVFFVFPIVALGGALTFWFYAMPAAAITKDLRKILKRAQKMDTFSALSALGPDWEIQSAKPDEWFRWEFPMSKNDVDRINIRMAVFDPNDHSERKSKTVRWLNNIKVSDNSKGRERDWEDLEGELDEEKPGAIAKRTRNASSGHFEVRNGFESMSVENMSIERDNDHILIQIEDDGAKLLNQKLGKMYLELAKIVDRAAVEMEATEPGLDLGEQVVLVHKDKRDSFWNKFSLVGNVALRIPFNRTWIHDVMDE